jgi:hypothetical protein
MNIILQNYLGSTFDNQSDDFQNPIPDSDYNNLKHMLNKDPINNEVYQLVKDKKSLTSSTSNVKINNEIVNVQLAKTNNKKVDNISSENFKTLKELANSNLLSVDDKATKILLEKTEQAIIESIKQLDLNKSDSNKSDIKKQLKSDTNKSDTNKLDIKNLYNKENYENESNIDEIKSHDLISRIQSNKDDIIFQKSISSNIEKKKELNKHDSEDGSVSYFKQLTVNGKIEEIYDNNKNKKSFIKIDNIIGNSSDNFKLILDDVSSIEDKTKYVSKKKNINKFNNL